MTPTQFKQIRTDLALSQKQWAQALGITTDRAIRHYEAGTRPVSGVMSKLARIFKEHPELMDSKNNSK